jgi:hypothetical protein
MEMRDMERIYTVSRVAEDTPCISIRGKWLKAFGLDLGSKVKIVVRRGSMILTKIPDEQVIWEREEIEMKELEGRLYELKVKHGVEI